VKATAASRSCTNGRPSRSRRRRREESLHRWRRFKRLEELARHDQMAVLKMIDALAERSAKRKGG
jgi:predicted DNA-binding ribbon-helix-helix protein